MVRGFLVRGVTLSKRWFNITKPVRFGEKVFLLRRGMMIDRQPAKILCSVEDIEKAWMERIGSKAS